MHTYTCIIGAIKSKISQQLQNICDAIISVEVEMIHYPHPQEWSYAPAVIRQAGRSHKTYG